MSNADKDVIANVIEKAYIEGVHTTDRRQLEFPVNDN